MKYEHVNKQRHFRDHVLFGWCLLWSALDILLCHIYHALSCISPSYHHGSVDISVLADTGSLVCSIESHMWSLFAK